MEKTRAKRYNRRVNDEIWQDTYARDLYFGLQTDVEEGTRSLRQTRMMGTTRFHSM